MTIGVYEIINMENNRKYIGSSINVEKRWNDHKWLLNNNQHKNKALQYEYNQYGASSFEFNLLAMCSVEQLPALEESYLNANTNLYNIQKRCKRKHDVGENISKGLRGSKNHMWGKHLTESTKQKISLAKSGSKNGRAKLNENQVKEIYFRVWHGETLSGLAKEFGVHSRTIRDIKYKKHWKATIGGELPCPQW